MDHIQPRPGLLRKARGADDGLLLGDRGAGVLPVLEVPVLLDRHRFPRPSVDDALVFRVDGRHRPFPQGGHLPEPGVNEAVVGAFDNAGIPAHVELEGRGPDFRGVGGQLAQVLFGADLNVEAHIGVDPVVDGLQIVLV